MSIVNLQKLEIKNALQIQGVKFLDERGYFTELYNETKFEEPITERWKQVSLTNSKQDVLRGIRSSNIAKLMSCLKGLVYVVIIDLRVDSETYLKWQGVWIDGDSDKNVHLYIPRKCGHAYFCQTDAICLYLQDETYKANDDIEYNPFDNRFKIEWPKPSKAYIHKYDHSVNEIIVEQNPPILVYGSNGFLGSALIDLLKKSNESYRVGLARLENRQDLIDEINTVKPSRVICMAGIAGKPNISWFETNKIEGVRANIIGQLNVADVSNTLGLHCTILTTGVIYKYDIKHPINSGIGYKEDEEPNFDGNFYSKLRIIEEKLLDSYPYLLSLRISYPTTSDLNPNSLVSKLIKYKNIQSIPLTITMVEDLWPILLDMSKRKISGIFNFNNEGCISHDEILELYKTIVDESHEWQSTKPDLSNRAACELDVSKLKNEGYHVPHVKESMTKLMQKLKQLKDAQSNDTNKEKIEKKKKILMTGGSFYPGSKLVLELIENNYEITIIEDSNNLKEDFQTELKGKVSFEHIEFYRIDTKNRNILLNFFKKNHFFAVVYQLNKPNENDSFSFDVYDESLNKTLNLIQCMKSSNVKNLVFVSTADVYGSSSNKFIDENHNTNTNESSSIFARCNIMVEKLLGDISSDQKEWNIVILRPFEIFDFHSKTNPTHSLWKFATSQNTEMKIFGGYQTADGTPVRDFIHVKDLAHAQYLSIKKLEANCGLKIYNLRSGKGNSILDILKMYEKVSGKPISFKILTKPNEPEKQFDLVIGSYKTAEDELGWKPTQSLTDMCMDLWNSTIIQK